MAGCTIVFGEIGHLAQNAALGVAAICGNAGMPSDAVPGLESITEKDSSMMPASPVRGFSLPTIHRNGSAFGGNSKDALFTSDSAEFWRSFKCLPDDCEVKAQLATTEPDEEQPRNPPPEKSTKVHLGKLLRNRGRIGFGTAKALGKFSHFTPVSAPETTAIFEENVGSISKALSEDLEAVGGSYSSFSDSTAPEKESLTNRLLVLNSTLATAEGLNFVGGYAFFKDNCKVEKSAEILQGDGSKAPSMNVLKNGFMNAEKYSNDNPSSSRGKSSSPSDDVAFEFDVETPYQEELSDVNDASDNEESPRGGLRLNAGYSSLEGISVGGKLTRNNILGRNSEIGLSARYSSVRTSYELGYADSDFAGSRFGLATSLFSDKLSAKNFGKGLSLVPFRLGSDGANLLVNRNLGAGLSVIANYRLSKDTFEMTGKGAVCDSAVFGSAFCGEIGKRTTSIASVALTLERKRNVAEGMQSLKLRLAQDISVGGSSSFSRTRVGAEAQFGMGGSWKLSVDAEGGYMTALDKKPIPLFERFYVGESTMRGFDLRGIGPKIQPTGALATEFAAIGGRAYYVARTELSVGIGGVFGTHGVRPSIFMDAGSVFAASKSGLLPGELVSGNSAKPRVAVGVGLALGTPAGKLRIDFAQPISKQYGDRAKMLSISFGARI